MFTDLIFCPIHEDFRHYLLVPRAILLTPTTFLLSSYSEKMRWGRGWINTNECIKLGVFHFTHYIHYMHYITYALRIIVAMF